jgi:nucleoside-diphosphate-sugar epimerase
MRVLIIGCGYVGLPVALELVRQGHEVFGVRRSLAAAKELEAAGVRPLTADITDAASLAKLPLPFDWIVNCVSAGSGGAEEYRRVYHCGMKNLVAWLAGTPVKKLVYTSSTGVYGQTDGSLVKETAPTEPATESGKVLIDAEQVLLEAAAQRSLPAIILRVAGIYGPGRGHYLKQFLKNEARIEGEGARLLNMIHRDDVAGIILAALCGGRAGEVYNAVDDEPVTQLTYFRWLAEELGKWPPPSVPEEADAARKRGVTNKKVSNRKLKMELGYQFKYPNFRKGFSAEIQRLLEAGELNIEPEPR